MIGKIVVVALIAISAVYGQDSCHTTPHPTYGLGYCIPQDKCPGSLYISNLCMSYPANVKCCYSGNLNCAYATTFTHELAAAVCGRERVSISSSGGCSDRNKPTCTSLEQVRCQTMSKFINWRKRVSSCDVVITGGTETGHASGTYSHWNGYKLDIRLSTCYDNVIKTYKYLGKRGDGADQWQDPTTNAIFALEGNHWDIVYN